MINIENVNKLIDEAYTNMDKSREMFGKEIYQKRFKPIFEGYITGLCTVLEMNEDERTNTLKGNKQ